MANEVLLEKQGKIAWIILNRPEKKNAMSNAMAAAIIDAVNTVQADSEIRVAILKGAGNTFCSGGDLSDLQSGGKLPTVEDIRPVIANSTGIIAAIQKCPKPIFAMVEGYAVGAGFSIALACDVVFAAEDAKFSSLFLHVGIAPEMGSMLFMPMLCGSQKAKEIWLSGRMVSAPEADRLGFVSRVCPKETLEEQILALAEKTAGLPSTPVQIMKQMTNSTIYKDLDAVLAMDMQDTPLCMQSRECMIYLQNNFRKTK